MGPEKAAEFVAESDPRKLEDFGGSQLASNGDLAKTAAPSQKRWGANIDRAIIPSDVGIQTMALRQLADFFGFDASEWQGQFAVGSPIAGDLSQKATSPAKTPKGSLLPRNRMFTSAEARFRERAPESGWRNAESLRKEAIEQQEKGMLTHPSLLSASGRPADRQSGGFNIAFRFGVEQADKLSACDDLKRSLTNQACRVRAPIKLVSWGHVAQMCRKFARGGRDWALFKADHEAAYKQLPLGPKDQRYAIIALRHPKPGIWRGFRSRTLMFGSIAAVLHYNVFSRLIAALFNRLFGIPLVCFFDDFVALTPRLLATKGLAVITRFFELLGIRLKPTKSEVGPAITFL